MIYDLLYFSDHKRRWQVICVEEISPNVHLDTPLTAAIKMLYECDKNV